MVHLGSCSVPSSHETAASSLCAASVSAVRSPLSYRRDARLKDIVGPILAGAALIALSPLFAAIAIAVKCSSPGPVFHRRHVLGGRGKPFDALKFRTMVVNADEMLAKDEELRRAFSLKQKLTDDPRTTRIGRILRRYSLDELPQLINVMRGQMWLIGPRMISPEEVTRYGCHAHRLAMVKPGMTGLWQVSGRQNTTYERRVELDMQYLDGWTLWLDLKILFRTFKVVLTGHGAY